MGQGIWFEVPQIPLDHQNGRGESVGDVLRGEVWVPELELLEAAFGDDLLYKDDSCSATFLIDAPDDAQDRRFSRGPACRLVVRSSYVCRLLLCFACLCAYNWSTTHTFLSAP